MSPTRDLRFRFAVALAGACLLGLAPARGAEPCRSAQFTIDGAPVGRAPSTSQTVEIGSLVGLGDVCPLTEPRKRRVMKNGVNRVRARWDSCPGFDGPVHLLARVSDDPVGAWRAGDRDTIRRLALLELREVGLRPPPEG